MLESCTRYYVISKAIFFLNRVQLHLSQLHNYSSVFSVCTAHELRGRASAEDDETTSKKPNADRSSAGTEWLVLV